METNINLELAFSSDSNKDDIEKRDFSDSEVTKKKGKKKQKFVDYVFNETILFDPNNESEINVVLDRINYVKDAIESRDIIKVYEIDIKGETFNYERHDDGILITHPVWSLIGFGENFYLAEKDLFENIKEVTKDYLNELDSELTDDAIELKKFLINSI